MKQKKNRKRNKTKQKIDKDKERKGKRNNNTRLYTAYKKGNSKYAKETSFQIGSFREFRTNV